MSKDRQKKGASNMETKDELQNGDMPEQTSGPETAPEALPASEIERLLAENARMKEELAARRVSNANKGKSAWQRQKERMAADPEYAAAQIAKRKKYAEGRREVLKNVPEKAAHAKELEKARRARKLEQEKADRAELEMLRAKFAGQSVEATKAAN